MQVYSDPSREHDPHALPDFEVFYITQKEIEAAGWVEYADSGGASYMLPGWYYWPCFPGCLPDGDPIGPFETEQQAIEDLRQC